MSLQTCDLPVFGPLRQQLAFPQEKFRDFKGSQKQIGLSNEKFLQSGLRAGNLETRQRQVGAEGAVFSRKAELRHGALNLRRQSGQFGRGSKARPENTRALRTREESEALRPDGEFFKPLDLSQRFLYLSFLLAGNLSQKLQRQMDPFRACPSRIRANRAEARLLARKTLANRFRQFDGNKRSHLSPRNLQLCGPIATANFGSAAEAFQARTARKATECVGDRRGSGIRGLPSLAHRRAR